MHRKAEQVQQRLRELGAADGVREFPDGTRTAAQAAAAIGTTVAQIAKSLVLMAGDKALLVVASGVNRVDTAKVAALVGEPVAVADAKRVKQVTGFAAGGVPPVGHASPLRVLIDRDLLAYPELWAAAGTPNSVFPTTPDELVRITGGELVDIRHEPAPDRA